MELDLQDAINFDHLPIVLWSLDVNVNAANIRFSQIHYINDSVSRITGWSQAQIEDDPDWWISHIHPDDVERVLTETRRLFKQYSIQFEYRFQTRSGDYIWCQDHAYVVDRTKNSFKVFGVSKEVTLYKELQSQHSELSTLFDSVTDAVPVGMLLFQDKIIHANPLVEKITGYTQDELMAMPVWELLKPELQPAFKNIALKRLQGWLPTRHYTDIPGALKDQKQGVWELHISSVDLDGRPAGVMVMLDKSEHYGLQKSLKLHSEILANSYDSIFVFKMSDKNIIYANKNAHRSLGYESNQLIGVNLRNIIHPLSWSEKSERINQALHKEKKCSIEIEQLKNDGTALAVETNVVVHTWSGEEIAVCVARDISERLQYEKQLTFSNELYNLHAGINQLITQVSDREELCRKVAQVIIEHSSIDAVWTGLVDWDENLLTVKQSAGAIASEFKQSVFPLLVDAQQSAQSAIIAPVQAIKEQRIVYTQAEDPLLQSVSEQPMGYAVSIPLRQLDRVVGVLNLYSEHERFITPEEHQLHQSIEQDFHFVLNRFDEQMESHLFFESVKQSPDWMMICDHKGRIEFVNDSVLETSGYSREELIGQTPTVFKSGQHDKKFYQKFWKKISKGEPFSEVFTNKTKRNEIFILDETVVPIRHCHGYKFVSLGRDISSEIELQNELSYLSFNDPITQTYNRGFLMQELPQILSHASRQQTFLALIMVDIKNFAMINDTYGFETGNEILKKLSKRFIKRVTQNDMVARFGSDEFAVVIQDLESMEAAYTLVDTLLSALTKPIKLSEHKEKIQLGGDFGVVTFPDGAKSVDELVHNVDLALAKAKKSTENSVCYYKPGMNEEAKQYLSKHNALVKAVKNSAFELHYQPYFCAKSEQFSGFESLVRWKRDGELVYPNHFIDELESSGLILKVENFIIETVFSHMVQWQPRFALNQRAAINLSPVNFKHKDLFERVEKLVSKTNVNPHHVTFEVVESVFVEDKEYAQTVFNQLRALGIEIAIDDFGTGYSSFSYLLDLPADYLKIDMSFVRKIKTDDRALAIVEGIIDMAHSLGMETIAEGVEDLETFRLLRLIGCDLIQGYYKARPMPCRDFDQFMIDNAAGTE